MIPYEELCAALDRHNNVRRNQAEMDSLDMVDEQPVEEVDEAAVVEVTPMPQMEEPAAVQGEYEESAEEQPVYSSAGEDAAAASGEIGNHEPDASTPPPVREELIQVEPSPHQEYRNDSTDEVSLADLEVLDGDDYK